MKITIKRTDDAFNMEATNATGNVAVMDASPAIGGSGNGVRPMEMLLMGVGGCSSIDIIHLLKKQRQNLTDIQVEVEGTRQENAVPSLFEKVSVHFKLEGEIEPEKALKTAQLSMDKYCSVAKIMELSVPIDWTLRLNGEPLK